MDAITTAKQIANCRTSNSNSLEFCLEQVRNSSTPVIPNTDIRPVTNTKNLELLAQQQKAKAQKLFVEKQAEIIEKKNLVVNNLQQNLENQLNALPNTPVSLIPSNPKLLLKVTVTKKLKELQKQIRNKTKTSLTNNVSAFSYPLKPMTPELPNITTPNVSIPNIPKLPLV
jgi:hypothetical protein